MREADIIEIANHAQHVIRELDGCEQRKALGKTYDAWEIWAEAKRVAPGIRNHITAKFHDLRREMADGGGQRPDHKMAAAGGDR